MSLIIKDMKLPQHSAVNGEKDTAYRCIVLAHPDNTVELVIDTEFTSAYDNGHNIQRYPIIEIPTPHGRLIDADLLIADCRLEPNHYEELKDGYVLDCDVESAPTIIEAEVSE
jgi:hypothetical protein